MDTRTTELHLDSWIGLWLILAVVFEILCWRFTVLSLRKTWAFRRRIIQLHVIDDEALGLKEEARQNVSSAFNALFFVAGFCALSYMLL